jgi:hypothetical protein
LALTIDQFPVKPTLSELPEEFIFAPFVPVSDSYKDGGAAFADCVKTIGKIFRKTTKVNIFETVVFMTLYYGN